MGRMKDLAIDLMSFEADELEIDEVVDLFATLIRSGMAWTLQGSYGRTAQALIDEGIVSPGGDVLVELIPA
ncbi:hypothetical protein SEA_ANIMUS_68 [Streptomyces phage Animus]|nr:hypothetical protein SEA_SQUEAKYCLEAN_69 [Streptomyces phage SqueakyClean]QFG10736.1 hypothetical protein SEA_ANIMUS_68 [Streptomyces phage Animus]